MCNSERVNESNKFKLARTKQCDKCPWRVDVNPYDIPNGYTRDRHCDLAETIAKIARTNEEIVEAISSHRPLKMMACHESPIGRDDPCLGWLNNQLGVGNNLKLRLHMLNCSNLRDLVLVGEQHPSFEDTIPIEKVGAKGYQDLIDYDPYSS